VFDYKRTTDVPLVLPLTNKNQPAGSLNVQLHSEENIPAHVKEAASAAKPTADDAKNDTSADVEFFDPDTTPPEKMVGVRISVKWAGNKWFPGVITEYNDISKEHRVLYDDKEARLFVCLLVGWFSYIDFLIRVFFIHKHGDIFHFSNCDFLIHLQIKWYALATKTFRLEKSGRLYTASTGLATSAAGTGAVGTVYPVAPAAPVYVAAFVPYVPRNPLGRTGTNRLIFRFN
jgi:hypothetical protein